MENADAIKKPVMKTMVIKRHLGVRLHEFDETAAEERESFDAMMRSYNAAGNLLEEAEYDAEGELLHKTVNTYNERGHLIHQEQWSDGVLAENISYEVDEKGMTITETRSFEEGNPFKTNITYNAHGQMIEKIVDDGDGELERRETWAYHDVWTDKIIHHAVYDEENALFTEEFQEWEEREVGVRMKQLIVKDHSLGIQRRTDFFDPRNREDGIASITYDQKDKVVDVIRVKFDEQGREIEETSQSVNPSDNFVITNEYDEQDRVIYQEQRSGDLIQFAHHRRFNEHGDEALHALESVRGMYVDVFEYTYYE